MRDFIRWLVNQLAAAEEEERSGVTAKQRLQLVLIQDRLDLPSDKMEAMKQEIWEVVSRYLAVAEDFLEFEIKKLDELVVLVSNIQVNDASELSPYLPPPSERRILRTTPTNHRRTYLANSPIPAFGDQGGAQFMFSDWPFRPVRR